MPKRTAIIFVCAIIFVGFLGFFPNPFFGADKFFQTDLAQNLAHIFIGIIMLFIGLKSEARAIFSLKLFSVIFICIAMLGFLTPIDSKVLGIFESNLANNWLHLIVGIGMLGLTINKNSEKPKVII